MSKSEIFILLEGYSFNLNPNSKAEGTVTLIKTDSHNIIVDTGLPCHKDKLINALHSQNLAPSDINVVVGTHGHSDHIGNLNLFTNNPLMIVSHDISRQDIYYENQLSNDGVYNICNGVYVMPTSGHTCNDISVIVEDTKDGIVAIVGDLFEHEKDILEERIWSLNSINIGLQRMNRFKVANIANQIIPGHGSIFYMTDLYKDILRKQMDV